MTVVIAPNLLCEIVAAALRRFPEEACGLLVGRTQGDAQSITEVHESRNVALEPRRAFEVDPSLRLRLQRQTRGSGTGVIGVFHSHPGGDPSPSDTDRASIWEPDLVWLITGVREGVAGDTRAFAVDPDGYGFHPVKIDVS